MMRDMDLTFNERMGRIFYGFEQFIELSSNLWRREETLQMETVPAERASMGKSVSIEAPPCWL